VETSLGTLHKTFGKLSIAAVPLTLGKLSITAFLLSAGCSEGDDQQQRPGPVCTDCTPTGDMTFALPSPPGATLWTTTVMDKVLREAAPPVNAGEGLAILAARNEVEPNQPFWISVYVPPAAVAGDYTATLSVDIPVALHVFDITIDHPGIESRIPFWAAWKYRVRGFAYYLVTGRRRAGERAPEERHL
jgi:hypothetical protein